MVYVIKNNSDVNPLQKPCLLDLYNNCSFGWGGVGSCCLFHYIFAVDFNSGKLPFYQCFTIMAPLEVNSLEHKKAQLQCMKTYHIFLRE